MTLTGTSTYGSPTTVNAGTLQVGLGGSGSIVSPVTVNAGGTLAGTGTVNNSVNAGTAPAGSTVAPGDDSGDAIGTLTVTGTANFATGTSPFTAVTSPILGLSRQDVIDDYLGDGASLAIQLDPSTPITPTWTLDALNSAADSDTLNAGALSLGDGSILDLSFLGDKAGIGVEFDVLDWTSLTGVFDIIVLPLTGADSWAVIDGEDLLPDLGETGEGGYTLLRWDLRDLYTTGVIKITPEPTTWLLFAMGLFGLALAAIRRKK